MKKGIKISLFIIGLVALVIISQYQLIKKETWTSWSLPLSGEIIMLDAGHGYPDGGAYNDGIHEMDIALPVVLKLKDYLQEAGALVKLTRSDGNDLADKDLKGYSRRKTQDLKRRLDMVNKSNADLFISIHLNALPQTKWRGALTLYHPHFEDSKKVAKFIQSEIKRNLENTSRNAKPINSLYLLKYAKMPSALVEIGFLSNPQERALLTSEEYQEKVAASIYQGILRYYTEETPPNS